MSQTPTHFTTAAEVMRTQAFQAGFADARAGRLFAVDAQLPPSRFGNPVGNQWGYERGWAFARLFPSVARLHDGRKLNPLALKLFKRAVVDRSIL